MFPLNTAGRIGLYVLLLLAGAVALSLCQTVVVPLLVALLLATVLGPAAAWLHGTLKIRWGLACITVTVGLILVNLVIFLSFSASVTRLVTQVADEQKFLQTYRKLRANLEKISPVPIDKEALPENPQEVKEIPVFQYVRDAAPWLLGRVSLYSADWSWQVIIILFTTFFVILEGRMLARRVVAIFGPSREVQEKANKILFEMAAQVRTYLVSRTVINLGLFVIVGTIFQIAGLSQAWTWAILLAVLNYIPYFGPVLASIPPFLDAFMSTDSAAVPFIILIVYWGVIFLEGWLIVPLLMGRSMDLNATTVMLACLFWPLVWGPTGLFLAMPLMAGIKAILHGVPELRAWADLMSSTEDPLPLQPLDAAPGTIDLPNGKPGAGHGNREVPAASEAQAAEGQL